MGSVLCLFYVVRYFLVVCLLSICTLEMSKFCVTNALRTKTTLCDNGTREETGMCKR